MSSSTRTGICGHTLEGAESGIRSGAYFCALCRVYRSLESEVYRGDPEPPAHDDPKPKLYTKADPVNHPAHYKANGLESINVIEAFGLGFCLGNVVKYILRHGKKGNPLEDLKKARWYLDRHIAAMEKVTK